VNKFVLTLLLFTGKHTIFNSDNVRLFLTSILLAAKFFDDVYYDNKYYAIIGGIKLKELNNLELEFLSCLEYRLFAQADIFYKYKEQLLKKVCRIFSRKTCKIIDKTL